MLCFSLCLRCSIQGQIILVRDSRGLGAKFNRGSLHVSPGGGGGGGGYSHIKVTEVLVGFFLKVIPKRYQDLVLWAWLQVNFTPKRYQNKIYPVIFIICIGY